MEKDTCNPKPFRSQTIFTVEVTATDKTRAVLRIDGTDRELPFDLDDLPTDAVVGKRWKMHIYEENLT